MASHRLRQLSAMPYRFFCLIASLVLVLSPASAQDFVVLDGTATAYEPGRAFRTGDRIDLPAGTDLALIAASGEVFRLEGPYSGALAAPAAVTAGPAGALASVTAILTRATRRTASLGASRDAERDGRAAGSDRGGTVWTVDGQNAGAQCVKTGAVKLLRRDAAEALVVTVWPLSGGARTIEWPAGERSLVLEDKGVVGSGTQLSIAGGKAPVAIILWQLPGSIDASATGQVLLWLSERGCEAQALQLAAEIARAAPVRK